ncbi:MAG: hypothetical protein PWQ42_665 [Sulfurospirillum sp.]|jgi:PAS domain S-box-containing protein|nr:hypothetical protein [Sulfurospirillum sp.]
MIKKTLLIFYFLILFFTPLLYAKTTKDVLLIHSYHKGYKWSDEISKVIEERFETQENVFVTTVYMDTKKIATYTYFEKLFELYEEQFKTRKFDLVIAVDNYALEFFIKYREALFPQTPMVFVGINNFDKAMLEENNTLSIATGVVEQVDIEKNIQLILEMHPKLEKILIINDQSKTGFAIKRDMTNVLPKYTNKVKFEYVDNIELSRLEEKVKILPDNTVILWVLLFKDKTGRYFTHKESLKAIKEVAKVPIYGLWDFYLNEGIVGGLLTSAKAQASNAAKMADMILKGAHPANIPILMESPNQYIFDYNELKRFELEVPKSILKYEMINKPFSFYNEYKEFVWLGGAFGLAIAMILVLLATNVAKRVMSEEALKNQLQFIRVLLDTVPNPINYKNLRGEFEGCNKAFADLFGLQRKDIIGKSVYDFFSKEWADDSSKKDKELILSEGSDSFEQTLHLPNGTKKVMTYTKTVYKNINGSIGGVVTVMDDITERNQQKQFLIQQSKLAEMGEMIAAVAHQWNEPLVELSAILQDLEFSYKSGKLSQEEMRDFVQDSMIQIQYMSKTLKDFRNFLKPSVNKVFFSAQKAIDEVLEIIGKHIFYSYISLHVKIENKEMIVFGYENEFKQVLLNVINNAKQKILAKKKKGNIYINVQDEGLYTRFQIIDDAGPIPDEIIEFIFDPYFTTNENGTGLGLYMAKVIIEDKMGGKIWARNFANKVIFNIEVPKNTDEKDV